RLRLRHADQPAGCSRLHRLGVCTTLFFRLISASCRSICPQPYSVRLAEAFGEIDLEAIEIAAKKRAAHTPSGLAEERADFVGGGFVARGVSARGISAPAVPVPEVDAGELRRLAPGATKCRIAAPLLVEIDRVLRALVPGPGRRALL